MARLCVTYLLIAASLIHSGYSGASLSRAEAASKPQIVSYSRHGDLIGTLRLSRNERWVATLGWDNTLKIWELGSGRLLKTIDLKGHGIEHIDLDADFRNFVARHEDGTLKIWSLEAEKFVSSLDAGAEEINSLSFTPDARTVVGVAGSTLHSWSVETGDHKEFDRVTDDEKQIDSWQPFNDGKSLIAAYEGGALRLWDMVTGKVKRQFRGHAEYLSDLRVLRDGKSFLVQGDGRVTIWDVASGKLVKSLDGLKFGRGGIEVDNDARLLVYSVEHDDEQDPSEETDYLQVVDLKTGTNLRRLNTGFSRGRTFAITADGKRLVHGNAANEITVWDLKTGKKLQTFGQGHIELGGVLISPDGRSMSSIDSGGLFHFWNLASGEHAGTLDTAGAPEGSVGALHAVSPDNRLLVSGGNGPAPGLWDLEKKAFVGVLSDPAVQTAKGDEGRVVALAISPDSRFVFSAFAVTSGGLDQGQAVRQWDLATSKLVRSYAHPSPVTALAISPDGRFLLTAAEDDALRLWDVAGGQELRKYSGFESNAPWRETGLAFADGSIIAIGSIGLVVLDATTFTAVRELDLPGLGASMAAVAKDGRWAVRTGYFGRWQLELWDIESGKKVRDFAGLPLSHRDDIDGLSISPDGKLIAVSGPSIGVRVWNAATGALLTTSIVGEGGEWTTIAGEGFFLGSRVSESWISVVRGLEAYSVDQFRDHLYRPDLVEALLKGDPEGKYKDAAFQLNLERILDSGPAPQIDLLERRTESAGGSVRLAIRVTDSGGGIGDRVVWRVNGLTQGDVTVPELAGRNEPSPGETVTLEQTLKVDPGARSNIEITAYNGAGLLATPPTRITVDPFGVTTERRPRMYVLAIAVDDYRMTDFVLKYAVKDAQSFAKAMEVVGSTLFERVEASVLKNEEVTRANIAEAFARIGGVAEPQDVFVLYLSGHGKSIEGRYYYYPQGLDFAAGDTVEKQGIGQDDWQAWLAKVGHVQKSLIVLDTCESAAAAGLVRGGDTVRQTAMDQLQHATGQNLLAASRVAAFEGYKGHGVLTYALLEALDRRPGAAADEKVKVGALADHIDERVPAISQSLFGIFQKPTRKLTGNDFPIGIRQAILAEADSSDIPKEPTHVLIREERVRSKPEANAPGERSLVPGTQVRALEFVGSWVVVARDGQRIGYVPASALVRLQ